MSVATEPSTSSSIHVSIQCRHFELFDIMLATQNFDESLVIGRGGFGKVYRGTIYNGSATVLAAIKRLDPNSNQGAPEFWAEVEMLSKLRHCNLVSLFGYCNDEEEMILVYEYMPNGTLEDHLHKLGTPLSWVQRLKICIGAGRGLHYLHTGTGIDVGVIHRDVKTSNILLQESWAAKISDFGLSKIGPTNQSMTYVNTLVKGTFGYFDPDYYATGNLTRKSDVFAFGVVLLEVLCRKRAIFNINGEASNLAIWAQESIKEGNLKNIVDFDIRGQISSKCLKEFVRIAERCLHGNPKQRSTMAEVLVSLESMLIMQEKFITSVQPAGRTILDRMVNMLPFPSNRETTDEEDHEAYLSQLKRFSLHELQVATANFSNRHIIGRGGFGKVYKGLLADGTLVAVKRLKEIGTQSGEVQFLMEVKMICMAVHRNLLRIRGFCKTPTERLLVYPYMANGSVASQLRERPDTLDWPIRKRIALGSARGLAYMHDHSNPKIIHRDVNATNILLDEEFEALVGDFGLAKLMDYNDTHVTTAVRGTNWYIDPEYLSTGKASEKTDVFGYGYMLLELITGQRLFDLARLANDDGAMLLDWVERLLREWKLETLVDTNLKGNYIDEEMEQLIQMALLCTQVTSLKRPKMSEVVRMLEGGDGLAERWEGWQKEELFRQEFVTTYNPNSDWIIADSTYNLRAEELSGGR